MIEEIKKNFEGTDLDGLDEFFALLEMPDIIFDQIYPSIKSELESELAEPIFTEMIKELQQDENFEEQKQNIIDAMKEIDAMPTDVLSDYKKNFVKIIFNAMITEPYDLTVNVQFLHKNSKLPLYANPTDTGADVYAVEDITIPAQARGFTLPTGLAMAIPVGWGLTIRPRSGLNRHSTLRVLLGTIDNGYRDELGVIFDNLSDEPYEIKAEDRICQVVAEKLYRVKWKLVPDVKVIGEDRGGGFGHTGR